jgi:hypothetical protein
MRMHTETGNRSSKIAPQPALVAYAVILATQEAEIRRIVVRSQPRQIVYETITERAGGVPAK